MVVEVGEIFYELYCIHYMIVPSVSSYTDKFLMLNLLQLCEEVSSIGQWAACEVQK